MFKQFIKFGKRYIASKLLVLCLVSLVGAALVGSYRPTARVLSQKSVEGAVSVSPSPLTKSQTGEVLAVHQTPKQNLQIQNKVQLQTSSTPSPTPVASSSVQPIPSHSTSQPTSIPAVEKVVNLQIDEPDGNFAFSVPLGDGENLCDNLTKAKDLGKIRSLTLTYYQIYSSFYVYEMNGYVNNWTFTFNGAHPDHGCSYYKPNSGDSVVWKFG